MICQACDKPCEGTWEDFGIGSYEYWGAPGCDVNWQWVSECCEDTIVDEEGRPIEPPAEYEDEGDYDPFEDCPKY